MDKNPNRNKNKKLIIGLIIAVTILAVGIALVCIGTATRQVGMMHPDWFESSSKRSAYIMFGAFLIVASVMVLIVSVASSKMSSLAKRSMQEGLEAYREVVDRMSGGKSSYYTCQYCGSTFDKSLNKCPNCSAPKTITKK